MNYMLLIFIMRRRIYQTFEGAHLQQEIKELFVYYFVGDSVRIVTIPMTHALLIALTEGIK